MGGTLSVEPPGLSRWSPGLLGGAPSSLAARLRRKERILPQGGRVGYRARRRSGESAHYRSRLFHTPQLECLLPADGEHQTKRYTWHGTSRYHLVPGVRISQASSSTRLSVANRWHSVRCRVALPKLHECDRIVRGPRVTRYRQVTGKSRLWYV